MLWMTPESGRWGRGRSTRRGTVGTAAVREPLGVQPRDLATGPTSVDRESGRCGKSEDPRGSDTDLPGAGHLERALRDTALRDKAKHVGSWFQLRRSGCNSRPRPVKTDTDAGETPPSASIVP